MGPDNHGTREPWNQGTADLTAELRMHGIMAGNCRTMEPRKPNSTYETKLQPMKTSCMEP